MNREIRSLNYKNRIVDALVVYLTWMFAYYLRFHLEVGGEAADSLLFRYLGYGFLLVIVSV